MSFEFTPPPTTASSSNIHWTQRPENKEKVRAMTKKGWRARKNKKVKKKPSLVAKEDAERLTREKTQLNFTITKAQYNKFYATKPAGVTNEQAFNIILDYFVSSGRKIKVFSTVSVE